MPMNERTCTQIVHERAMSAWNDQDGFDWSPWFDVMQPICELCGCRQATERHHRQFRSRGGKWVPSNILDLCSRCHQDATEERAAPGVNVSQWKKPAEVPVKLWYTDSPVCLDDTGGYDSRCGVDNE